ncbi:MAG: cytochrome P450 [Janthinobacterium lividum]
MIQHPPLMPQRFIGQALFAFRRDPIAYLRKAAAEHGDIVRLPLTRQPLFLVNHPDLIKDIFVTRQKQFKKGRGLERAKKLLGEGLLTSEDPYHLRQRRLIQPAFHRQRIAAYAEQMTHYAVQTSEGWADGETRDMAEEMLHLALAIVGKTLFNAEVEGEAGEIGDALTEVIALFHTLMLPMADLLEKLPIPSVRRFARARARLDVTIYRLIEDHRRTGGDRGDLLSMLLLAQDEEDGERMTDLQVRDEALTIFLAGHETTANAMAWTWYLLSQHPDVEAKFHAELDSVLAGRTPTLDDLPNLPFTRRVLAESLRMYSPAWVVGRRVLSEYTIEGYVLRRGDIVLMSQAVMHYDTRFWSDPERFDPDRWTPEAEAEGPKFAYFPFGGGPRVCIGEQFAWMEEMLLLATLGQQWQMRLAPDQIIATQPIITLRPKFGMRMILKRR